MSDTKNTQHKVTRICKSRSSLLILLSCILPFVLIFTGFNTPVTSQAYFWQSYQNLMVIAGLAGLALSYWMILFKPNAVIKLVVKEKAKA